MSRHTYSLTVNGATLRLVRDRAGTLKLLVDGPPPIPGATIRYTPIGRRLLEIETTDGTVVYRDSKLRPA